MDVHGNTAEPWHVTLVDTGENTMTGGRLKRIAPYVANEESFCMTYGDGVGDVNITALLAFHRQHGKPATLTAVQPRQRFGVLERKGDQCDRVPGEGTDRRELDQQRLFCSFAHRDRSHSG